MPDVEEEWVAESTARERVDSVTETVTEPTSVAEIAELARVSQPVARDQLSRLEELGRLTSEKRGQTTFYQRDESQIVFQRMQDLLDDHSREDVIDGIKRMKSTLRELEDRHGVRSPAELAQQLDAEDESGWDDLTEWRTTKQNLAIAQAALSYDEATDEVLA